MIFGRIGFGWFQTWTVSGFPELTMESSWRLFFFGSMPSTSQCFPLKPAQSLLLSLNQSDLAMAAELKAEIEAAAPKSTSAALFCHIALDEHLFKIRHMICQKEKPWASAQTLSDPLVILFLWCEALVAKIGDKAAGQSALESLAKIAEEKGRPAEPFLVSAFPKILEAQIRGGNHRSDAISIEFGHNKPHSNSKDRSKSPKSRNHEVDPHP